MDQDHWAALPQADGTEPVVWGRKAAAECAASVRPGGDRGHHHPFSTYPV